MSNPTPEQQAALSEWLEGRPEVIRDLARRFPPWGWFRKRDDAGPFWLYSPVSYSEDGTLTMGRVSVATGEGMWQVFGIKPESLEPCGSPEEVRATLSEHDLKRAEVMTQLYMMGHQAQAEKVEAGADTPPVGNIDGWGSFRVEFGSGFFFDTEEGEEEG